MAKKLPPRGIRNNNPLNIRKGNNWKGERHPQTDKEFEEFESMQMGLRAAFIILRNYMTGYGGKLKPIITVDSIVHRWAPEVENATESYINFVADDMGVHRYQKLNILDREQMIRLVAAMAFVECGVRLSDDEIGSAYDLLTWK